MYFENELEEKKFAEALALLNQFYGSAVGKKDFYKNTRNNLIVFKGGDAEKIESSEKNNSLSIIEGDKELMKNVRQRIDGRWEFRKMINCVRLSIITKTKEELLKKIRDYKKSQNVVKKQKIETNFYSLCKNWIEIYKKSVKTQNKYFGVLKNYFEPLKIPISQLDKDYLQKFLNNIPGHRNRAYASYIIKGTFQNEYEKQRIKFNVAQFLKLPKVKTNTGTNFSFEEQKLILDNLDKTPIKSEILFYLLTGCRKSEPSDISINYEKNVIFINGTKTKSASRYVPISKKFSDYLKINYKNMFVFSIDYYYRQFKEYLNKLGIKNKTLHDTRHTFSTNLYYLGVPDKQRQAYLGHSSIIMTNDIYTHLDPSITKNDIVKLYNNLYPEF